MYTCIHVLVTTNLKELVEVTVRGVWRWWKWRYFIRMRRFVLAVENRPRPIIKCSFSHTPVDPTGVSSWLQFSKGWRKRLGGVDLHNFLHKWHSELLRFGPSSAHYPIRPAIVFFSTFPATPPPTLSVDVTLAICTLEKGKPYCSRQAQSHYLYHWRFSRPL